MKKFAIVLAGTVMLAACGGEKDKSADVELKSEDQKASYALGFRSAEQMSAMENLDLDAMVAGLRDGFGDEPESRLGEDADMDQLIRDYQTRMMEARQKKMEEQAQGNLEEARNSSMRTPTKTASRSPTAVCSTRCWNPATRVPSHPLWKTPWKCTTRACCATAPCSTAPSSVTSRRCSV